jgi:hypothetical protein
MAIFIFKSRNRILTKNEHTSIICHTIYTPREIARNSNSFLEILWQDELVKQCVHRYRNLEGQSRLISLQIRLEENLAQLSPNNHISISLRFGPKMIA